MLSPISPQGLHQHSASITAAANSDPAVLRAVLARHKLPTSSVREELEDDFGPNSMVKWPGQDPIITPLLQAIRSQLLENVEILLQAGANPSGADMSLLEEYQALFLRFRPSIPPYVDIDGDITDRKTLLQCMELSQTAPFTELEIEQRVHAVTPFWMFSETARLDHFPLGDEMHSLVAAARQSSIDIFDRLLSAGADASFWMSGQRAEPNPPNPSSLSVTTPLHAAVESVNIHMIHHLLSKGFDPNIIALSTPLSGLTPLMTTFLSNSESQQLRPIQPDDAAIPSSLVTGLPTLTSPSSDQPSSTITEMPSTFNLAAYNALVSYKSTSHVATSAVLFIHPLHLAVAYLSLPLLQHVLSTISLPLSDVLPTALGHNLLHVACMPLSADHINTQSRFIFRSIHDTRDLGSPRMSQWAPCRHTGPGRPFGLVRVRQYCQECGRHLNSHTVFNQTEVLRFLLSQLPRSALYRQDTYGNTPLHYLVAHRTVNKTALELLRSAAEEERSERRGENSLEIDGFLAKGDIFTGIRNRWGHSVNDLLVDAARAEVEADAKTAYPDSYSAENETAVRDLTRRIDAWWDERILQQEEKQQSHDDSAKAAPAGSRGPNMGRGRRGRVRNWGTRGPAFRPTEFPYRVFRAPSQRQEQA